MGHRFIWGTFSAGVFVFSWETRASKQGQLSKCLLFIPKVDILAIIIGTVLPAGLHATTLCAL